MIQVLQFLFYDSNFLGLPTYNIHNKFLILISDLFLVMLLLNQHRELAKNEINFFSISLLKEPNQSQRMSSQTMMDIRRIRGGPP